MNALRRLAIVATAWAVVSVAAAVWAYSHGDRAGALLCWTSAVVCSLLALYLRRGRRG